MSSPALGVVLLALLVAVPLRVALGLGALTDPAGLPLRCRRRLGWWRPRARATYLVCAAAVLAACALQIHHALG